MCLCEKTALMEQAIHTNTIAHFLMHHMAHGENNLKHLTTPTQCGYWLTCLLPYMHSLPTSASTS